MRRIVLALIVACCLTLLPFKVAVAGNFGMSTSVTVLPSSSVSVPLQTTQPVSNEAQARDSQGAIIPISRGNLTWQVSEWKAKITLPMALAVGQTLVSFTDPASGVDISEGRFTIPLTDADGNVVMSVVGDVEQVQGEGNSTDVIGKNVMLTSGSFSGDLSASDAEVGQVSASFEVLLRNLSQDQNASVKIIINKDPDTESRAALELAAEDNNLIAANCAYILDLEKTNLENGINLGEANVTMKVGQTWAARYGVGNATVLCRTEAGKEQLLCTEFKGYENGQAVFQATSPGGLEVFTLAALLPVSPPAQSHMWTPIAAGTGGAATIAGLLFFLILRRRKKKKATPDGEIAQGAES